MATIDEQISAIDQEIADMEFAESKAKEQGLGLGQYDLQSVTAARKRDRLKEESPQKIDPEEGIPTISSTLEDRLLPEREDSTKIGTEEKIVKRGDAPLTKVPVSQEEQKEREERLPRWKDKQNLLREKLIEKYPESAEVLSDIENIHPKDRGAFFNKLQKNYQLKDSEMIEALGGEGQYKQFIDDTNYFLEKDRKRFGKLEDYQNLYGKSGEESGTPWFGLRFATYYKYKPRTESEIIKEQEEFKSDVYKGREGERKAAKEADPLKL